MTLPRWSTWVTHRWMPWAVLLAVLVVAASIGGNYGTKISQIEKNNTASWLPAEAESTKVIAKASAFSDPNATAFVIAVVNENGINDADLATLAGLGQRIRSVENVNAELAGPYPSTTGKAVEMVGTIVLTPDQASNLPDRVQQLRDIAASAGSVKVYVGGPAAINADQSKAFGGAGSELMLAAIGVVVLLLLLMYRSPVLWILPLVAGVVSVYTAQGVVYLLAKYANLTVNGQSAGILPVLVLGASIDYALLIVARYREELHHFADRREAMAHALHRSVPTIIASGMTVMAGLLCLMLAQLTSTAGLGPVGAAGIATALIVMLTLLPAMLVICGRWIFWPFVPRAGTDDGSSHGLWARVGQVLAKRPRAIWIATAGVLALCTLGLTQLNATGLSTAQSFTNTPPSITAQNTIDKYFPAGEGSPLDIVANPDYATQVGAAVAAVPGVESVSAPEVKSGTAFMTATLNVDPQSPKAQQIVQQTRTAVHKIAGAEALVGGATAVTLDVQNASQADNHLIIPVVLLVVFLILAFLLRALAISALLLATVALSYFATLGIGAWFFKHVFGFAGTDAAFPLYAFVFLVALGIDYNIFLMTRVREEALNIGTRKGMLVALAATGGVITSAGLVLAGTFGTLAVLPIVFLTELGFVVAIGVLIDTVVVRSILVTSLVLDIGRPVWWPSRLARTEPSEVAAASRED